jgi:hypothetical protein
LRTLPAGYVAEHVEHAYCLTGHGMQGGTVENATVVATPRALTRGWRYTALSCAIRNRGGAAVASGLSAPGTSRRLTDYPIVAAAAMALSWKRVVRLQRQKREF